VSYDSAAYLKARRERWLVEGRCGRCGEPNDNGKKTCQPCIEVMCAKQRDRRRMARVAAVVLPKLEKSVKTGQGAYFSPSESLKLTKLLEDKA